VRSIHIVHYHLLARKEKQWQDMTTRITQEIVLSTGQERFALNLIALGPPVQHGVLTGVLSAMLKE